jgi:5-methylcytosine-specific restriction endonuclease McrA
MSWKVNPVPAVENESNSQPSQTAKPANKKHKIPKAIKEQIWLRDCGKVFETKCRTTWCQNRINVWDFQAGHNIPESKGGSTTEENLVPICSRCNLSMSNNYTFTEWCAFQSTKAKENPKGFKRFLCFLKH